MKKTLLFVMFAAVLFSGCSVWKSDSSVAQTTASHSSGSHAISYKGPELEHLQ